MSKETHGFSVSVATEVGVHCALILQHLLFLQKASVSNGEDWQQKWVKRSLKSMRETYPYLTEKELRGANERLERDGYTFSKIENEYRGDRTKSYQLTRKGLALMGIPFDKRANGSTKGQMSFDKRANENMTKGQMLIKEDCNSYKELVETTTAKSPSSFKAENNRVEGLTPPPAAAPAFGRVDIAAEVERLRTDQTARENFTITRKIPADRFERYVADFSREVRGTTETYWKVADFRRHFFNWCEIHYRKENERKAAPTVRPALPPDMINLNAL